MSWFFLMLYVGILYLTAWPGRSRHQSPLTHQELLVQWRRIMYQKVWTSINLYAYVSYFLSVKLFCCELGHETQPCFPCICGDSPSPSYVVTYLRLHMWRLTFAFIFGDSPSPSYVATHLRLRMWRLTFTFVCGDLPSPSYVATHLRLHMWWLTFAFIVLSFSGATCALSV
jgi:hypothetical protein